MAVTLKLSVILALAFILALRFGHNVWAGFFSDSPVIISSYASMTPLLVISIILDSIQGVLSGLRISPNFSLPNHINELSLASITYHEPNSSLKINVRDKPISSSSFIKLKRVELEL